TAFGSVRELIVGRLIVFILQGSAERRKRFIRKIYNIINLPIPTAVFDQIDSFLVGLSRINVKRRVRCYRAIRQNRSVMPTSGKEGKIFRKLGFRNTALISYGHLIVGCLI